MQAFSTDRNLPLKQPYYFLHQTVSVLWKMFIVTVADIQDVFFLEINLDDRKKEEIKEIVIKI